MSMSGGSGGDDGQYDVSSRFHADQARLAYIRGGAFKAEASLQVNRISGLLQEYDLQAGNMLGGTALQMARSGNLSRSSRDLAWDETMGLDIKSQRDVLEQHIATTEAAIAELPENVAALQEELDLAVGALDALKAEYGFTDREIHYSGLDIDINELMDRGSTTLNYQITRLRDAGLSKSDAEILAWAEFYSNKGDRWRFEEKTGLSWNSWQGFWYEFTGQAKTDALAQDERQQPLLDAIEEKQKDLDRFIRMNYQPTDYDDDGEPIYGPDAKPKAAVSIDFLQESLSQLDSAVTELSKTGEERITQSLGDGALSYSRGTNYALVSSAISNILYSRNNMMQQGISSVFSSLQNGIMAMEEGDTQMVSSLRYSDLQDQMDRSKDMNLLFQGTGLMLGAGLGTMFGGPAGAAGGMAIGSQAGTFLGSLFGRR